MKMKSNGRVLRSPHLRSGKAHLATVEVINQTSRKPFPVCFPLANFLKADIKTSLKPEYLSRSIKLYGIIS